MHRTISINTLDFTLFEKNKRFQRKVILLDKETKEEITDLLALHFIKLEKHKILKFKTNDLITDGDFAINGLTLVLG